MRSRRVVLSWVAAGICPFIMAACGSSGPAGPSDGNHSGASTYAVRYLVSDGAVPADHVDANLKNPWGIVFNPNPSGPVWVANNGTQTSTLYDGSGTPFPTSAAPFVFNIPAGSNGPANPTGIVYNASTSDFMTPGPPPAPSSFIFDGEGGTIAVWGDSNLANAVTAYDDHTGGAVYKGLAIANSGGANFLYATDFHNNKIDVFDKNFAKATSPGGFKDPALPAGYAPFGIQNIAGKLVVTYAQQKAPDNHDNANGAGLGYVDLFDAGGVLIKRLVSGSALNAPWGVALAPADFGSFSNAMLIGNFGDGLINAYDSASGQFLGTLGKPDGQPIRISGLWGIAFGTGNSSQPTNTLFFAAGINNEVDGVYGRIDLAPAGK